MNKGNIVVTERGERGIVLAVRKDGTRALFYRYGPDFENWVPVEWLTVEVEGLETCFKCSGSGLYYFGGPIVNGVYQGKTGPCFGCEGKGQQSDDDRARCHNYWHRRGADVEDRPLDASPQPEAQQPTAEQEQMMEQMREPAKPKRKIKSTKQDPAPTRRRKKPVTDDDGAELIDCKGCGTLHREDTMCPW
jgi:hypothetical protein